MSTAIRDTADGGSPERGLEVVRDPGVITAIRDVNQSAVADFLYSHGAEIMGVNGDGSVVGHVPTPLIDTTEIPVRESKVRNLMERMQAREDAVGGDGQEQPSFLNFIPGVELLKIADGFHRAKAQQRRGKALIFSGVLESDWDGLYDRRIENTNEHKEIGFARTVIWMKEIWELTGFSEHMTLEQAMLLVGTDLKGARLNVDPDIVRAAREWGEAKVEKWGKDALTIRSYLKISGVIDPELVEVARMREAGEELDAPTQDILQVLADEIPNNHELQQMVVDTAIDHNLPANYVRTICREVQFSSSNGIAGEILAEIDWDTLEPTNKTKGTARISRHTDPRAAGERVLDQSLEEIKRAIERAEAIAESGEPLSPDERRNVEKLDRRIRAIQGAALRYTLVIDKILDLPDAPAPATAPAKKAASRGRPRVTAADKYAEAKAAREKDDGIHLARPKTRDGREVGATKNQFEEELLAYLRGTSAEPPFVDTLQTVRSAERILRLNEKGFPMADRVEEILEAIADHKRITGK